MWTLHTDSGNNVYGGQTAKNIYLGETRIVTKLNSGTNPTYQEEYYKQYYYHSDHLGSASLISDYKGDEYQRIEYTPYGETWVEKTDPNANLNFLPYKFTAKEMDEETGLYYYGARYLDPRYSRWISTDPALGEYIPAAGKGTADEIGNLPGVGGAFNSVNLNFYHYAENNPIKYTDPDGNSGTLTIYSQRGVNSFIPKTDKNGYVLVDENQNEINPSSWFYGNHAWISFTDDETGETTFYGTWGHDSDGCSNKGLRVNDPSEKYEAEQTLAGVDIGVEYRALQLDDKQQGKFEKYIAEMKKKGDNAWGYWYPCSNFAAKAWKKATGEKLQDRHLFGLGYSDPNVLADSIQNKNEADNIKQRNLQAEDN